MSRKIASPYVLALLGLMVFWSGMEAQALPKLPFFGKKSKDAPRTPSPDDDLKMEEDEKGDSGAKKSAPSTRKAAPESEEEDTEPARGRDITEGDEDSSEMGGSDSKNMSEGSEEDSREEERGDSEERGRKLPGERIDRSVLEESKELEEPERQKEPSSVDPRKHYLIAKDLLAQKQYKACLTEVNKALALNPHYWDAMYVGCLSLQLQERNEEAIRKYRRLVKYKPDMVEAHVNLGVLLKKAGALDESELEYKKAIEVNFYKVDPHYNLANLLIEKGDLEGALSELKTCVKLAPRNAWVHNNLGVIYQKRNYFEEAAEEFNRAIKLEPANKTFQQNLHSVQSMMKKRDVQS